MRPARRALAAFLALLGVASCGGTDYTATKTQIMVTVAIPDTALRAQTSQLRVSVSTQRGALWKEEPAITLDASVLRWPVQIPVYPRKASETSYPIEVVVEALAAQGRLAQARVLTHYEPGARGSLPVALFTCAGPDPVCQLEACHGDACRVCSPTGTCAVVGGETPTVPEPHGSARRRGRHESVDRRQHRCGLDPGRRTGPGRRRWRREPPMRWRR